MQLVYKSLVPKRLNFRYFKLKSTHNTYKNSKTDKYENASPISTIQHKKRHKQCTNRNQNS